MSAFVKLLSGPLVALSLFLAVPIASYAETAPGNGMVLRPARGSWNTGWFEAAVFNKVIKQMGYDVQDPVTLDVPIFFTALAAGEVDFWPHVWVPEHLTYFKEGMEFVGDALKGQAIGGYLIDKVTSDKYNIKKLEDLKNPEVAKLFDKDGDGKADMVACPPGWACEVTIEHHFKEFGLNDTVTPVKAAYEAAMADTIARYKAGEPILYFTWRPNWTVWLLKPGKDVVFLEAPYTTMPGDNGAKYDPVPDVEGCPNNPCMLPFASSRVRPVFMAEFLKKNPVIKRFFEVASIPVADVDQQNAKMHEGEDSEADINRHADEWIAAHKETVDDWIAEASKAAK